jgi:hypothetical protein
VSFVFAGYFPKRIVPVPVELNAPHVREVWSVSNHISHGPPDGWIEHWVHNELWLFDTPELARSVLPSAESASYTVVAYRLWTQHFVDGKPDAVTYSKLTAAPCGDFTSIGFDVVSSDVGAPFECSPLSCNYGARTIACNEFCLFSDLDAALLGAKEFSGGSWEPGTYRVVEVLRKEPV